MAEDQGQLFTPPDPERSSIPLPEEQPQTRRKRSPWWVYPVLGVFMVGFAIAFVAVAALLWMITLGGGCALGWCPFS